MASKESRLLKIVAVKDLKEGKSFKFDIPRKDRKTEAFIVKSNSQYYAYLNLCRHWTVGLDFDDNDFFSEDKEFLICKNHGALYEVSTGICQGGPCGGAALYRVPVVEQEGMLYANVAKVDWGEM